MLIFNFPSLSISCLFLFFDFLKSGSESWSTWNCLQNCLKSGCRSSFSDSEKTEISFLKRCVSMVIQRLARSSEPWTVDTLRGTVFSLLLLSLSLFRWLYLCIRVSIILVRAYVSSSPSLRPSFSLPTFFPPTFLSPYRLFPPSFFPPTFLSSHLPSSYLPAFLPSFYLPSFLPACLPSFIPPTFL